jgi:hypothetical protein
MPAGAGLRPVLREAGFEVDAISPLLTLPPDILLRFKDSGLAHQDHIRPDVVLCRQPDGRYGVVECKGNSFGVDSSTAKQARTLLVAAGPRLDESLGLKSGTIKRSVASYLVPSPAAGDMGLTLQALDGELRSGKLPVGTSCVLALEPGAAAVSLVADGTARGFFNLPAEKVDFVRLEEGTDPRPLYFIPYDPDLGGSQSEEERAYCKRVLFERIQASLLGAGGRALPPADLPFDAVGLLNDATFGMYGLWENKDSAKHMRKLVRQLLTKLAEILRSEVGDVFRFVENQGWTLQVPSESTKDAICNALSKFSCETMDLRQEPPQLELFEDQADE